MRKPEDLCLLCKSRHSTNTQSHIVPRFISKSIFGDAKKQGFLISTGSAHKPAMKVQDSAKEDYILCPECERYFEILETYIAARIQNRLWDTRKADQFDDTTNEGGIRRKVCLQIDQWVFRLFIYSIVWRCSISETAGHRSFKLLSEEEELLRKCLSDFYCSTQTDLLSMVDENYKQIPIISFLFATAESFGDKTANVITSNPLNRNPYHFLLGKYLLLLTFTNYDNFKEFDFLLNDAGEKIKIGFFKEDFWVQLRSDFMKRYAAIAVEQTKANGLSPYINPNLIKRKDNRYDY